jgi:hypothetical protein
MFPLKKFIVLTSTAIAFASAANATIIYDVNRAVGSGGVVGFIETDGTIGRLNTSNILNWNLIFDDGTVSVTLNGLSDSLVIVDGSAFSATLTDLQFNFGANGSSIVVFFTTGAGVIGAWCLQTIVCSEGLTGRQEILITRADMFQINREPLNQIGVARSAVPEPTSIALLGAGLTGLGYARRRKRA